MSLGETRAAAPLVARPPERVSAGDDPAHAHDGDRPRGRARALSGDAVVQAWLPYDVPFAVRRFLAHFRPAAGLLLETELWPNLLGAARDAGVPAVPRQRAAVGSARRPATRGCGRSRGRASPALAGVAAQAAADAERIAALGASAPFVTGNLKFDVAPGEAALALGRELRAALRRRSDRCGSPRRPATARRR